MNVICHYPLHNYILKFLIVFLSNICPCIRWCTATNMVTLKTVLLFLHDVHSIGKPMQVMLFVKLRDFLCINIFCSRSFQQYMIIDTTQYILFRLFYNLMLNINLLYCKYNEKTGNISVM
jgi:hypothetical protein